MTTTERVESLERAQTDQLRVLTELTRTIDRIAARQREHTQSLQRLESDVSAIKRHLGVPD